MKNIKLRIAILAIIVLAGIAFAMGENPGKKGGPGVGQAALDFSLNDLSGKAVKLSDYRGKTVFLNFFATWCPPCREEMPSIQALQDREAGKDFVILAVSLDKGDVKAFISKGKYSFKVLADSTGDVAGKYQVTGIPTTLIIDKKGIIRDKVIGGRDWSNFKP